MSDDFRLADADRCCAACSHVRPDHADGGRGACGVPVIDGPVPTRCGCAGWVAPGAGDGEGDA